MKQAKISSFLRETKFYDCQKPWAENCYCQAGGKEITPPYATWFFEAFPNNPDTFIRGEGATIAEAEEKAWEKFLRYVACPNHEFEARGYENGCGFCKRCNMFSPNVIPSPHACPKCGQPNWYSKDVNGSFWCKEHWLETPDELLDDSMRLNREAHREMADYLRSQQGDSPGEGVVCREP